MDILSSSYAVWPKFSLCVSDSGPFAPFNPPFKGVVHPVTFDSNDQSVV